MTTSAAKTERLHALDTLRAIMMLLGIVLHSAVIYGTADPGNPDRIKDPVSIHASNDFIVAFIHTFRMPVFFLVAGFFGAMLFYERSPLRMFRNRVSRIVLPLMVFIVLLYPSIKFAFNYTKYVFAGKSNAFSEAISSVSTIGELIPDSTVHLWFLYYLAMITFVSMGFGLLFLRLPRISDSLLKTYDWIIRKPLLRVFVFANITCLVFGIVGSAYVFISNSLVPDFNTFIYFFSFYMIGWGLFKSKQHLDSIMKYDWMLMITGIILFCVYFFRSDLFGDFGHVAARSMMIWMFIFGFTGLSIRYASQHSPLMRYVADSSYWVYLIHLPLVLVLPSAIVHWPISATLKFLTVLAITSLICFVSYHYLVRDTFIGKFLNGRRYPRGVKNVLIVEDEKNTA
ncbi:MAG: acyltransferase family protein [Lewinellaceae bacterium]|nr:acyltransferase family protein [Saprospiraceae bacterium]MCB9342455.1 acyltransferase family protein [Lewinellaceae bacterium]